MRPVRVALATFATALLVSTPAYAGKTKTYAPPGKAGTSQYSEIVPTAGGNVLTPAMGGGNRTAEQISHLGAGRAGVRKLSRLGKEGAAAAQFAQETAPPVTHPRHGLGQQTTPGSTASLAGSSGGSALSGVARLVGGSDAGGIGVFLPLLLALGLVAALAAALLRRRPRGPGAPGV